MKHVSVPIEDLPISNSDDTRPEYAMLKPEATIVKEDVIAKHETKEATGNDDRCVDDTHHRRHENGEHSDSAYRFSNKQIVHRQGVHKDHEAY